MTPEEAIDFLEEVCTCTDPLCPDIVHRETVREARRVLKNFNDQENAEYILEQQALDYEPPVYWEP